MSNKPRYFLADLGFIMYSETHHNLFEALKEMIEYNYEAIFEDESGSFVVMNPWKDYRKELDE